MSLLPRTNLVHDGFEKRLKLNSNRFFELKPTRTTPYILLDRKRSLLILKGKSSPESAQSFYNSLKNNICTFLNNNKPVLVVLFKLEYFNTSSAKCIFDLLSILKSVKSKYSGAIIKINWYYESYDDDMLECGKDYSEVLDLEFNFITIN